MKKKFLGAVVVVAIAVGAMINVNLNKVSNTGELVLANVEALATESGSGYGCINGAVYGGIGVARLCGCCCWQFGLAGYSSTGSCNK